MLQPLRQKKMWFGQPLDAGLLSFGELDKHDEIALVYPRRSVSRGNKY